MVQGIDALKAALRERLGKRQNVTPAERRAKTDMIARFGAPDALMPSTPIMLGNVPAARFEPVKARCDGCVIYVHGGAFVAGSSTSHAYIASRLATGLGAPVFALDYRLAPEHVYPAALEDVMVAVDAAAALFGSRHDVALAGDSAGGSLALLAALRLCDEADNVRCLAVISPVLDFQCSADSYDRLRDRDPFISRSGLMQDIAAFLGPTAPDCSELSPLTCRLSCLPPLLIQVGSEEVLIDDAIALEKKVREAGGRVELNIWPDMVHVWHLFPHYVEEADQAIAEIVAFLGQN